MRKFVISFCKQWISLHVNANVNFKSLASLCDLAGWLCCDYIKKYSRPIGCLYFYRSINIILSAD